MDNFYNAALESIYDSMHVSLFLMNIKAIVIILIVTFVVWCMFANVAVNCSDTVLLASLPVFCILVTILVLNILTSHVTLLYCSKRSLWRHIN